MCLRLFNDPAMYLIHFCFSLLSSFLLPSRFGIIGEFFLFAWLFARPTSFIQLGFALCTVHTHMERHKQTRIAAGEERTNSSHMCLLQFSEDATICFFFAFIAFRTRCSSRVGFSAIRTCVSSRSSGASTHLPALRCLLSHLFCKCVCVVHRLPTICALKQKRVKIHTFLFVDATLTHIGSTLLRM